MKGLITTFILIGLMVIILLIIINVLSPAGAELMQNTAGAEQIVP